MADSNPERFVCLWNTWLKLNYIPVLIVHLITYSLRGIAQDLYFKQHQL